MFAGQGFVVESSLSTYRLPLVCLPPWPHRYISTTKSQSFEHLTGSYGLWATGTDCSIGIQEESFMTTVLDPLTLQAS